MLVVCPFMIPVSIVWSSGCGSPSRISYWYTSTYVSATPIASGSDVLPRFLFLALAHNPTHRRRRVLIDHLPIYWPLPHASASIQSVTVSICRTLKSFSPLPLEIYRIVKPPELCFYLTGPLFNLDPTDISNRKVIVQHRGPSCSETEAVPFPKPRESSLVSDP